LVGGSGNADHATGSDLIENGRETQCHLGESQRDGDSGEVGEVLTLLGRETVRGDDDDRTIDDDLDLALLNQIPDRPGVSVGEAVGVDGREGVTVEDRRTVLGGGLLVLVLVARLGVLDGEGLDVAGGLPAAAMEVFRRFLAADMVCSFLGCCGLGRVTGRCGGGVLLASMASGGHGCRRR
jgi:hypothetical protein